MSNERVQGEINAERLRGVPRSAAKRKSAARKKYGRKASQKVERSMHEMKRGKLRSGRSKRKVKSRKQAIAIGLNEARKSGGKVPKAPKRKAAKRKKAAKKRKSS